MESGVVDPDRLVETHLARVLVHLREVHASGVLEVEAHHEVCEIFVSEGVPVYAEGGSVDDSLGRVLLRTGRITEAGYARVLARMTESLVSGEAMRFGEVAITLGLTTPEVVMEALRDQVRHKVERCMRSERARWVFREDRSVLEGLARFPLRIEQVVFDALREEDEAARWDARLARWGGRFVALHSESGPMATTLGLTATRLRVMRSCDGTRTLEEVLGGGPLARSETVALVVSLLLASRIELLEHRRERAAPTQSAPRAERHAAPAVRGVQEPAPLPTAPHDHAAERALAAAHLGAEIRAEIQRRRPAPKPDVRAQLTAEQSFDLGKRHLREGRLAPAHRELVAARDAMPGSAEVRLWVAFAEYLLAGSADRELHASTVKERALVVLTHDKTYAFAHHALGRIAYDAGDDAVARKAFRTALALDPHDVEAARIHRVLTARAKG